MTTEQEVSVYTNARLKLLDVYLRILDKIALDVDFEFVIEPYDEVHYKITVDASDFPQDFYPDYYWYNSSTEDHLIIAKDELYKVRCTVSAPEDSVYYGFKEIRLYAPGELSYEAAGEKDRITVAFTKYETKVNMPEPITYVAELYQGETLVDSCSNTTGETDSRFTV